MCKLWKLLLARNSLNRVNYPPSWATIRNTHNVKLLEWMSARNHKCFAQSITSLHRVIQFCWFWGTWCLICKSSLETDRMNEWVGFNGTSTQLRSLMPSLTWKAGTESPTAKESRRYINIANATEISHSPTTALPFKTDRQTDTGKNITSFASVEVINK